MRLAGAEGDPAAEPKTPLVKFVVLAAIGSVASCSGTRSEPIEVSFVRADPAPAFDANVTIDSNSILEARNQVFAGASRPDVLPTFVGAGPWQTWTLGPSGRSVEDRVAAGRTFVRRGGSLRLDVRLGAGDRGAFMGGVCESGAERAMLEVEFEDRDTLGARFTIRLHALQGGPERWRRRPDDLTPTYLRRPVPRGAYRAWVDVPPRGARYIVEVNTIDQAGDVVGRAWSSPIAMERPWLQ